MTGTETKTAPTAEQVRAFLERDIVVIGEGFDEWAVLSLDGFFRYGRTRVGPVVIHSALNSSEEAEVARRFSIQTMLATATFNPYGPNYPEDVDLYGPLADHLIAARSAGFEGEAAFVDAERKYAETNGTAPDAEKVSAKDR